MNFTKTYRRGALVLGAVLILTVGTALADGYSPRSWNDPSTFQRFSLSVDGGLGLADGRRGTLDAKTEFQLGLSRRFRIGLGVGYLDGGNGWRRDERMFEETNGDATDSGIREPGPIRNYRVLPVSLNLYYRLPLSRRWSLFASGGASYYWGWFHGFDVREQKNTWGGQGGLGAEYRLSRSLALVAQGEYRYAEFHGLAKPVTDTTSTTAAVDEMRRFSRVDLTGAVFHLGVKIGF